MTFPIMIRHLQIGTLRVFRRQPGRENSSNAAPGAVNSVPNSLLSQATFVARDIGVRRLALFNLAKAALLFFADENGTH